MATKHQVKVLAKDVGVTPFLVQCENCKKTTKVATISSKKGGNPPVIHFAQLDCCEIKEPINEEG